jgi:SAM-dependent methyltransferase
MQDNYAVDAAYYDLTHADQDDDVGLWLSFAGRSERPVLEVGVGTGRIALALARAGHTATGLDPSAAMLAIAREKAGAEGLPITLLLGTALEASLEADAFGFVLVPQDVFLYCEDEEEQLATLLALARCMHFNATLALDLPGPALWLDPDTNGQPLLVWSGETPAGEPLDVWHVHEDDLGGQTRWLRVSYERLGEGGLVRRENTTHNLRYVYRYEAEHLLEIAGLVVTGVYGDYDLGPLTNESERMIVVARRRDG